MELGWVVSDFLYSAFDREASKLHLIPAVSLFTSHNGCTFRLPPMVSIQP